MTNYAISVRKVEGRPRSFGKALGKPHYLQAPDDADRFDPSQGGNGAAAAKSWAKAVIAEAEARAIEIDGIKTADVVVFLHGYNVDAKDALFGHHEIADAMASKEARLGHAVLVSYDWPSNGEFLDYLADDLDARKAGLSLIPAGLMPLALFSEPECRIRVHVIAHSMGALVLREALRGATGHRGTRDRAWSLVQTVLIGADISAASLAGRDGWALHHYSQRVTNYFNRHDKALAASNVKRVLTAPRLGRHGAPVSLLREVADIDVSMRWLEVARTNKASHAEDIPLSHTFYAQDPVWRADFGATIRGDDDRRAIETRDPHPVDEGRLMLKEALDG